MKKNLCVVELKGGFGNQLFQYGFAYKLRTKGFRVKVSNAFFTTKETNVNVTPREEILPSKVFGFNQITIIEKWLLIFLKKINDSKKVKLLFPFLIEAFYKYYKEKDLKSFNISHPISHFDGYWQNYDYIDSSKDYLTSSLSKNKLIREALKIKKIKGSTLVHVRRQDYLSLNEELNIKYYELAIKEATRLIEDFNFSIFTDDPEWVSENEIFKYANFVYFPKNSRQSSQDTIETFSKMLQFENFIIANSSFSYMAAFLGSGLHSKIFYPNPWFKNRESKNLSLNNWIKIQNY